MNFASAGVSPAAGGVSEHKSEDLTRIGDMARQFGVTLRALRFYEDKGLISPIRNGATRLYRSADKTRLKFILLGRRVGFSLREVKQMIDLYDPQGSNVRQLKVVLEKSERQRGRLEKQRREIDQAIVDIDGLIAEMREQLQDRTAA
ncbi:MAG: MerR family DNA-binding transcriptional regulator [Rhizobiaceae bacterium]|nr:MerR family DNA-binding transcriptional regulator [Rhizobiaceae bacterium]